jgi:energy-coupling factor transport system substrate-specific component
VDSADPQVVARPFSVSSGTLTVAAIGAVLYVGLNEFSFVIPDGAVFFTQFSLSIIPFIGIRFGAVTGFLAGVCGCAFLGQLRGVGFVSWWDWIFAEGLIGLVAGIAGFYLLEHASPSQRVIRVGVSATLAGIVGLAFTATDILMGATAYDWLMSGYLPAMLSAVAAALLVPLLDHTWESL